jgi:hypothetical protein
MTAMLASTNPAGARLLLRRGDTFAVPQAYVLTKAGVNIVGAYGDATAGHGATDPRPRLTVPDLAEDQAFSPRDAGNDWRFMDLDFVGPGLTSNTGSVGPPVTSQTVNTLMLRLKLSGDWNVGVGWGYWTPTVSTTSHDLQFVVECEVTQTYNCGMYVGGVRLVVLGNTITDGRMTHLLRVWQAFKGVIAENVLLRPGGQRCAIKLHGIEPNYPNAVETRWVTMTGNVFEGSNTSQWTVSIGSQSDVAAEASPVSHLIIDRNKFAASPSTVLDIETEASHVVIRNNVLDDSRADYVTSFLIAQRNASVPTPSDYRVYNNTLFKSDAVSDASALVQTNSTALDLRVRNNLLVVPALTNWSVVQGTAGAGYAADHNLLTAATASTVFTAVAGGDFSLPPGSPAVDQGAALAEVRRDFLDQARPLGSGYDLGALESR